MDYSPIFVLKMCFYFTLFRFSIETDAQSISQPVKSYQKKLCTKNKISTYIFLWSNLICDSYILFSLIWRSVLLRLSLMCALNLFSWLWLTCVIFVFESAFIIKPRHLYSPCYICFARKVQHMGYSCVVCFDVSASFDVVVLKNSKREPRWFRRGGGAQDTPIFLRG